MTSRAAVQDAQAALPAHAYAGIAVIVVAEVLLFAGNQVVGGWFTPIVWTGYILAVDGFVYRVKGRSLLVNDRLEFLVIVLVSIPGWWLFEFYNSPRFWTPGIELWWHYHNLDANLFIRRIGYDWAFATIFPALFETAELLEATLLKSIGRRRPLTLPRTAVYPTIAAGAIAALLPLIVVSEWLVPLVWLSLIFLIDPINYLRGGPSILGDIARGDYRRLGSLAASGAVCGLLWEFWNYWAITKWTYTVPAFPYLGDVKLFEMPVLGYLGFLPFTIECWCIYAFCRSLLNSSAGAGR